MRALSTAMISDHGSDIMSAMTAMCHSVKNYVVELTFDTTRPTLKIPTFSYFLQTETS